MMRFYDAFDVWMRTVVQTFFFFLGRKFGVTRRGVVTQSAWSYLLIPLLALVDPNHPMSAWTLFVLILISLLINGIIALAATVLGLRALERNEDWGSYSNWITWRWLRLITIMLLPVDMFGLFAGIIIRHDYWDGFILARTVFLFLMLYGITCRELPPREKKTSKFRRTSEASAH